MTRTRCFCVPRWAKRLARVSTNCMVCTYPCQPCHGVLDGECSTPDADGHLRRRVAAPHSLKGGGDNTCSRGSAREGGSARGRQRFEPVISLSSEAAASILAPRSTVRRKKSCWSNRGGGRRLCSSSEQASCKSDCNRRHSSPNPAVSDNQITSTSHIRISRLRI